MAVSVKDFLDAIRGRYQDEPNKVEVTGSNDSKLVNTSIDLAENESTMLADGLDLKNNYKDWILAFSTNSSNAQFEIRVTYSRLTGSTAGAAIVYTETVTQEDLKQSEFHYLLKDKDICDVMAEYLFIEFTNKRSATLQLRSTYLNLRR